MQLPGEVRSVINEFAAKFPAPIGKSAWRVWMTKLAETVAARFGAQWGLKKASNSRPVSADTLALRMPNGRLVGWDIVSGAGSTHPRITGGSFHDLTGQVFVSVNPVDHMGDADTTIPDGTVDPNGGAEGPGGKAIAVGEAVRKALESEASDILTPEINERAVHAAVVTTQWVLDFASANPPRNRRGSGEGQGGSVENIFDVTVELEPVPDALPAPAAPQGNQ